MDTPERCQHHFAKPDNFCREQVVSLVFKNFQKLGLHLKEKNCLGGAFFFQLRSNFFPLNVASTKKIFPCLNLFSLVVYPFILNVPLYLEPKPLARLHGCAGRPGPRGYKIFSCSTQLSLNFDLLINLRYLKQNSCSAELSTKKVL